MIVVLQSSPSNAPRFTAMGSCARGAAAWGTTKWKRRMASPTEILPRASSSSGIGARAALPLTSATSPPMATRPLIPAPRWSLYPDRDHSRIRKLDPSPATTKVLLSVGPTVRCSPAGTIRSSTILPPRTSAARSARFPVGGVTARITAVIWPGLFVGCTRGVMRKLPR